GEERADRVLVRLARLGVAVGELDRLLHDVEERLVRAREVLLARALEPRAAPDPDAPLALLDEARLAHAALPAHEGKQRGRGGARAPGARRRSAAPTRRRSARSRRAGASRPPRPRPSGAPRSASGGRTREGRPPPARGRASTRPTPR